ncbi:MAG: DISARM system phospholipase D-like protein DrmC [Ardenticatenaceae bacterium]
MKTISQQIAHLAQHLPHHLLFIIATKLEQAASSEWDYMRAMILSSTPQSHYRTHVEQLLERWQTDSPTLPASTIAFALKAAAHTAQPNAPTTELIWTGPTANQALRRTEQALLQIIEAAQSRLLLVSFTTYPIPAVTQALQNAIKRGIELRICLEAPQSGAGKINYDTIQTLGEEISTHAQIYIWPRDKRTISPRGQIGTLHAKCAVADTSHLFISSANLTDNAMSRNIELGVLIEGGPLPAQVREQFEQLMQKKILKPLL